MEVGWLTTAFWFYLAWDFLDVYIATTPIDPPLRGYEERWATRAVSGMYVTLAFTLFFSCIWYFVWTKRQHPVHTIVAFDLAMLILLLAYRITQEKRHPAQEKKQATGRVDGDRSTSTSVGVRH